MILYQLLKQIIMASFIVFVTILAPSANMQM